MEEISPNLVTANLDPLFLTIFFTVEPISKGLRQLYEILYNRNSKNETRVRNKKQWQSDIIINLNSKSFLLLWFWIPLLGLTTPEVQSFIF